MDALTRLKQAVDAYYPLSQETWSAIAAITNIKLLAKDEWLYKEGEYLTTFAFLHQGLFRLVNTNAAGQEYNKRFFAADMSPIDSQVERYIQDFKTNRNLDELIYAQMELGMKDALRTMDCASQYSWCSEQAHLALGTLLLVAASMEIDVCPMTGIDKVAYDDVLGLSSLNLRTVLIAPIGIRDSTDVNANTSKVRKSRDLLHIEV